ncbi:gastrula zinc finger protein 5-1-like [Corythoichthys intestinalis]|uniref:gastrula zinc finger protein 5-1-like n=1 Tax=Corythoichthys intestinalis TaxID=161448 RepID=UPI0025A5A890|nr:gastrula zinc finger protein 5-1-like [Corythoichthys intestinalis]
MGHWCCVKGCRARSHDKNGCKVDHDVRFFRFPTWKKGYGQQVEELTKRRRMAWVAAVRRKGITFDTMSPFLRVCSRHFHKGEPAYEMMENDPDWAPSLHLGQTSVTPTNTARSARGSWRKLLRTETLQEPEMVVQQDANIEELQTKEGPSEPGEMSNHQQNEEGTPDAGKLGKQMRDAGTQWPDLEDHNYFSTMPTKNCATQTDPAPSFSAYDLENNYVTEQNLHLLEHDYPQLQQEEGYEMVYVKQEAEPETPYIKEEEQEEEITNFPMTFNVKIEEDDGPSGAAQPWSDSSFQHLTTKDVAEESLHSMNHDPPHIKQEEEFEMVYIKQEAEPETSYIKEEQKEEITNFPITVSVKIVEDEAPSDESGAANPLSDSSYQHLTTKGEGQSQPDGLSDSDEVTSHSSDTDTDIEDADQNASKYLNKSSSKRKTKQRVGAKPFACSFCYKRFRRKYKLTTHTRTHTGDKPFLCTRCGKSFTQNGNLNRHIRTHTGEKSFACSYCEKRFGRKQQLTIHTRIHTGEKLFPCTVCGKSFIRKQLLTTHMNTHTEEKPFLCTICGIRFTKKGSLNNHKRTHAGEKPFACSFCNKRFYFKRLLKKHARIHTG